MAGAGPRTVAVAVTLNVGSRDVPLQWLAPETGGRPDAYHLQYRLGTASDWPDWTGANPEDWPEAA